MPVLFLTVVIDLIGFGIIIPIMPFMAPELGGNDMDIALIIIVLLNLHLLDWVWPLAESLAVRLVPDLRLLLG